MDSEPLPHHAAVLRRALDEEASRAGGIVEWWVPA